MTDVIFKTVIENINHAIIISDKEGNFILWNNSARKILGMSPDITDKDIWQDHFKIYKMDGVKYNNNELPIMQATTGKVIYKERLFITTGDGTQGSYLEVDAFPIKDENGHIVAAVASFTDVTNIINLETMFDDVLKTLNHLQGLIRNSFYS